MQTPKSPAHSPCSGFAVDRTRSRVTDIDASQPGGIVGKTKQCRTSVVRGGLNQLELAAPSLQAALLRSGRQAPLARRYAHIG